MGLATRALDKAVPAMDVSGSRKPEAELVMVSMLQHNNVLVCKRMFAGFIGNSLRELRVLFTVH